MQLKLPFFLIAGRTGSGKDHLKKILEKNYAWDFVKSYTTRPKRNTNENTHIFITPEEAAEIPESDIVARTNIAGYDYFATEDQIHCAEGYIIDPTGIKQIVKRIPYQDFIIVYLRPISKEVQEQMAISRADDIEAERAIFKARYESENQEFSEFEEYLRNDMIKRYNIVKVIDFVNDYSDDSMEDLALELDGERYD